MNTTITIGLLIPLLGTIIGSGMVFLVRHQMSSKFQKFILILCLRYFDRGYKQTPHRGCYHHSRCKA